MEKSLASVPGKNGRSSSKDAVALLRADHRQVEKWFEEFQNARSIDRKQSIAAQICAALRVHTMLEEEIFYPAFLAATSATEMHHEAIIEHAGAKKLIAEIETANPGDDYYNARMAVLAEMIRHHVKEEERPTGMFAAAKKSGMDLVDLGRQLRNYKQELEAKAPAASRQDAAA